MTTVKSTTINAGDCIKKLSFGDNDVIVFQVPVPTEEMTEKYVTSAKHALEFSLPEGRNAVIMGNDIDIYSVTQSEAVSLKLKGLAK